MAFEQRPEEVRAIIYLYREFSAGAVFFNPGDICQCLETFLVFTTLAEGECVIGI